MKKLLIFFAIVVIIVCVVSYVFLNYKANYNTSKKANLEFENYLNEEIYGTDLSTVINRAIDSNEKNAVEKNNKGIYLNNDKNSISIEVKMNFLNYYGNIKFKCTDIKYHKTTNKVKYMLFEQITS